MQPGTTITPGGTGPEPMDEDQSVSLPRQTEVVSAQAPQQAMPQVESEPQQTPQLNPIQEAPSPGIPDGYNYALDDESQFEDEEEPSQEITWSASEFVHREKSPMWYGALAGLGIAAAVGSYFLFHDIITAVMMVVITIAFGIVAARRPKVQQYAIADGGIQVNQQFHDFADYRAFSVVDEGAVRSIVLLPLKRFGFGLTVYAPPELEEDVFEAIADHLPFLDNYKDPLENLLRRIHF